MTKAVSATVSWDPQKKKWHVRIQVGAEVIKRAAGTAGKDAADDLLRTTAVQTAKDEGYDVDPAAVTVVR